MSGGDFSRASSRYGETPEQLLKNSQSPKHGRDGSATKAPKQPVSPANRERVTKQVGSTSSTFIGPACRPDPNRAIGPACRPDPNPAIGPACRPDTGPACRPDTNPVKKDDIEDTLSKFYKELEDIDSTDSPEEDAGRAHQHLSTSTRKEFDTRSEKDSNTSRLPYQKHPSWPHWYQNEPYHPRGQRSDQWGHLPPFNRPPHPRFHRLPPPSFSAFPRPHGSSTHMGRNWTNQYQEVPHFQLVCRFPPPNECPLTQDFDGRAPRHFDRNRWGSNNESNNADVGWSRKAEEGWCQPDVDSAWNQRFKTEEEPCEPEDQCQPPDDGSALALILMRGLPGSGKSTLAKELLSTGPNGLILSTDDYFGQKNGYVYDPSLLGPAHDWNQSRAKEAMHKGHSPVIIDNTNIQAWEMKPYVKMALERGYRIYFHEPDTGWKFDPSELEKRNKHGVPQEKIAHMLDRFSFPISIDIVMSSPDPPHVTSRHQQHNTAAT